MKNNKLKFYCDNKNFKIDLKETKPAQNNNKNKKDILEVIDGKIVLKNNNITENDNIITSRTYLKKKSSVRWTKEEMEIFYKAIKICGCDFSLIEMILKNKTRKNIKDKYLKEIKLNKKKMDKILENKESFNKQAFQDLLNESTNL